VRISEDPKTTRPPTYISHPPPSRYHHAYARYVMSYALDRKNPNDADDITNISSRSAFYEVSRDQRCLGHDDSACV
jgi:hypothetical protein